MGINALESKNPAYTLMFVSYYASHVEEQAAGRLKEGMVLTHINGVDQRARPFRAVVKSLKVRPVSIHFSDVGGEQGKEDGEEDSVVDVGEEGGYDGGENEFEEERWTQRQSISTLSEEQVHSLSLLEGSTSHDTNITLSITSALQGAPLTCGWLEKKGKDLLQGWKQRWYV
jgi:hypothetical protein